VIKVRIPPTLRSEVGGAREVEAIGSTMREVLADLAERFPGLGRQVLEDGDGIAPFVNVYLDSEDVRTLEGLDTQVREGSTVILLPAMAGGERTLTPSLLETIGDTPLVELPRLAPHPGVRSAETLAIVKGAGYSDAVHVGGGVSAWVNQVDPSQPSY